MDMEILKQSQQTSRQEKGQILLLLALAFVGLLAFIGLAMDVGILFISVGHLRRGVDSAALAAAAQFREGRTYQEVGQAATEFFELNQGFALSGTLFIETCMPGDPNNPGASLCLSPPRKFVRVSGQAVVPFTFLRLIGFQTININSRSVSEAASLDVVLILDTSESMAFDASCNDGDDDDNDGTDDECGDVNLNGLVYGENTGDINEACLDWGGTAPDCYPDDYYRDPLVCNSDPLGLGDWDDPPGTDTTIGECHPFEEVQEAAMSFVSNLNTPFDRIALVTFAQTPFIDYPLQSDLANASNTIRNLSVTPRPGLPDCNFPADPDPSDCTSTSIGGGLRNAASAFSQPLGGATQIREESLWVAVLLSDGSANASIPDLDLDPKNFFCPPSTWPPWPPIVNQPPACRDSSAVTRHSLLPGGKFNPNNTADPAGDYYDTDDYAHDMADLVACPSRYDPLDTNFDPWCLDSLDYPSGDGGQDALIFTVGLGDLVINTAYGDPDAGEQLLRYVAGVGFDGHPNPNFGSIADECLVAPSGTDCGNYFFAPTGAQLIQIFEEIASRIFTRLTQ
jgi:hypothetical protein